MNYECFRIQKTIKSLMKSQKKTYSDLARLLNTSPATIKRRLNGEDISLNEIKDIADALNTSFYEIFELSRSVKKEPYLFTHQQEKVLASDYKNLMCFRQIVAGAKFNEIIKRVQISEGELRKIVRLLEQVNLAKLLPEDKITALVKYPFRWQSNGVLQKTYHHFLLKNILQRIEKNSENAGYYRKFEFILNDSTYKKFCDDIHTIYTKYLTYSEFHIEGKPDLNHIVSGLFFIDQFSAWDNNPLTVVR